MNWKFKLDSWLALKICHLPLLKDRSPSASSRPRIEDKLGLTSDNDEEEGGEDKVPSESSENSSNMDDTVVSSRRNQEWDFEVDRDEVHVIEGP